MAKKHTCECGGFLDVKLALDGHVSVCRNCYKETPVKLKRPRRTAARARVEAKIAELINKPQ